MSALHAGEPPPRTWSRPRSSGSRTTPGGSFLAVDAERARRPGRRDRRPAAAPAARRRADRDQGRALDPGLADDGRLAHPRGLPSALRRDLRRAARGRRRDRDRQDEHGRVRDGLVAPRTRRSGRPATRGTRSACPAARAAAPPRRSPPAWRRRRSAATPAARSASPPRSAASSASSRPTAAVVALRPDRVRVVARPGRPLRPHGARRGAAASRHRRGTTRWTRPRSTGPSRRRSRDARRDLDGVRVGVLDELSARASSRACAPRSRRRSARWQRARRLGARGEPAPSTAHGIADLLPASPRPRLAPTSLATTASATGRALDGGSAPTCSSIYEARAARGFGPEVKRRIMLGTFALASGLLRRLLPAARRRCGR